MAKFSLYKDKLLLVEGGYVDHPLDRGGPTKFGVTLASWQRFGRDLNNDGRIDANDVKLMTEADAVAVYKTQYWDKINGDKIKSQAVAEIVFDMYVNAPSIAVKMLQNILNRSFGKSLAIDGALGPMTLQAVNSVDAGRLHDLYKQARVIYYNYRAANIEPVGHWPQFFAAQGIKQVASQKVFLKGWLNRVATFADQFKKKSTSLAALAVVSTPLLIALYALRKKNKKKS
jgi:lysozyme family protein